MSSSLTLQPDGTVGKDAGIDSDSPTNNSGTGDSFSVITTGGGAPRRSLLQFDISSIPSGSTVDSAILTLKSYQNRLSADSCAINRVTQAWTEAGVTWNKYDGSTNWATAGGDFDAVADATFTPPALTDTTVDITITSLVQEWVNGTANNGMIIKAGTEATTQGTLFYTSDAATAGNRPKLVVTYTLPGGFSYFM
jgi:hypothetical protein